jgi:hypothetical protein
MDKVYLIVSGYKNGDVWRGFGLAMMSSLKMLDNLKTRGDLHTSLGISNLFLLSYDDK